MKIRGPRSLIVSIGWLLGVGVPTALGGCVALAGTTYLPMPIATSAPRGFPLKSVVAIQEPDGVRFHGAACRRTFSPPPLRIRVDRIDASGQLVSSTSRMLSGLGGHARHCTFFDVPTPGDPSPGESARVCAQRTVGPCPAASK